jgi:uncharacterized protein (DUF2252 family)
MAADLASHPNTGIQAQLCGDGARFESWGIRQFHGRLVFDINDFDETIRGPFEWNLNGWRRVYSWQVALPEWVIRFANQQWLDS